MNAMDVIEFGKENKMIYLRKFPSKLSTHPEVVKVLIQSDHVRYEDIRWIKRLNIKYHITLLQEFLGRT